MLFRRIILFKVLLILSITNAYADWYTEAGRSLTSTSMGPVMPTNIEECREYGREMDEKWKEAVQAHEDCLASSKATDVRMYSSNGKLIKGTCGISQCQELHDARDSILDLRSENMKKCYADVAEYKVNHKKDEKKFNISIDNDRARDAIEEHMRNKKGVVAITALDMAEMKKSCEKALSIKDQNACIDALHKYASDSRHMSHSNPIIKKIQDSSAEQIKIIQKNTLKQGTLALRGTKSSSVNCDALGTEKSIDTIDINADEDEMSKQISRCK